MAAGEAKCPDSKPSSLPSLEFKCTVFWSCQGQRAEDIFLSACCALGTEGLQPRETELAPQVLRCGPACAGWVSSAPRNLHRAGAWPGWMPALLLLVRNPVLSLSPPLVAAVTCVPARGDQTVSLDRMLGFQRRGLGVGTAITGHARDCRQRAGGGVCGNTGAGRGPGRKQRHRPTCQGARPPDL